MTPTSDDPRRVSGIEGVVVRGAFGAGTKSERDAIWLESSEGRFVLRRKGGPTFDDKSLDRYVGKRVTCDGFLTGYTLLAERISVLS